MPLTFPSHAAAVVPLKLWRPGWCDGVAIVLGSTAPDLPYALHPYIQIDAHGWWALVWFCVPVTLLGTYVTRRAAPLVAACLPDGGPFHLRDYGVIDRDTAGTSPGCARGSARSRIACGTRSRTDRSTRPGSRSPR